MYEPMKSRVDTVTSKHLLPPWPLQRRDLLLATYHTAHRKYSACTIMGILDVLALRDYRLLLTANIAEFCGSTLAELALLIFLYDATGSAIALGGLGGAFVLPISVGFVSTHYQLATVLLN